MPRSRGLTIYLCVHVAATLTAFLAAAVNLLAGAHPDFGMVVYALASLLAFFQAQFLAAWIVLGSSHVTQRLWVGASAILLVFAESFLSGIAASGWFWFPLKVAALIVLSPLALVVVGLAPELICKRRIRFVAREHRQSGPAPQFSLRTLFGCVLLTAVLATAAQFFPIHVVSEDEAPLFPQFGPVSTISVGFSFGANFLAIALVGVVAAYLLLPSRVGWLLPAPLFAAVLGGVVTISTEMLQGLGPAASTRGATPAPRPDIIAAVGVCAVASLLPIAHYLILRACGYRLVTAERSPAPGA